MRTTKIALVILACGVALVARPVASWAEGEATFGGQWWTQTANEARFQELRDVPRGGFLEEFWLAEWKGKNALWLYGANALRDDQVTHAGWANGARFRADLEYTQSPHTFSNVARSPWVETRPGIFTFPDSLAALIQRNSGAYNGAMRDAVNGSSRVRLGFLTDVASARLRARPAAGLSIEAVGTQRTRSGSKPYGASLGFNNAYELWEPIDQTMVDADLKANWAKNEVSVQAAVGVSMFDNKVDRMRWDNPRTNTDIAGGNGPAAAQLALYPDNREIHGNVALGWKLPKYSVFTATAGLAQVTQDQDWLPLTSNNALRPDTLPLPGTNSDAKADVVTLDARLTTRAVDNLSGTVRFSQRKYDNKTPEWTFARFSAYDVSLNAGPVETKPFGSDRWTAGLDVDYTVTPKVTVGATAEFAKGEHTHREIEKDDETVFGGRVRTRPTDFLNVDGHYRYSDRTSDAFILEDYEDATGALVEPAGLRRYDIADRKQSDAGVSAGYTFGEKFDAAADYSYLKNEYDAAYGLLDEQGHQVVATGTFHASPRVDLNGGYGFSTQKSGQKSNETSTGTGPMDDAASDWSVDITDENVFYFGGVEWQAMPGKFRVNATYEFSRDHAKFDLTTGPSVAANAPLPSTLFRRHDAMLEGSYQLLANTEVAGRWQWQEFDAIDFAQKGISQLGFSGTTLAAIFLGDFYQDYRAHQLSVVVRHRF